MQNSPQGQDIFVVGAQGTPWSYFSDSPFLFSPSSSQLSFHRSPLTQMPGLYPSASYHLLSSDDESKKEVPTVLSLEEQASVGSQLEVDAGMQPQRHPSPASVLEGKGQK